MSERYTLCPSCKGTAEECIRCDGTGFDGSALAYLQKELDQDWEREQKSARDFSDE